MARLFTRRTLAVLTFAASTLVVTSACRDALDPNGATGDSAGDTAPRDDGQSVSRNGVAEPGAAFGAEGRSAPAVQLVGRFDMHDALGPRCGWPGCRIVARFEATRVSVVLQEMDEDWMEGAPSEWDVIVDGVFQQKLVLRPGVYSYPLAENLVRGAHTLELYKRSETQNGVTELRGIDLAGGKLLPPPPRAARRIEIVGDSAAAGFGIEGVGLGPDCPGPDHAARWQNFHASFGARLGDMLGAEVEGTVASGKGIAKNIWHPDKETMPMLFDRAIASDPASTWDFSFVPHAVVIMMGGNDFAIGQPYDEGPATQAEFLAAYDAFVAHVRAMYPSAFILLTVSPSTKDSEPEGRQTRTNVLAGVRAVADRRNLRGDRNVAWYAPAVASPSELTACNGHGTRQFHERVAMELATVLRPKLGW